jgi:AraC-like DNA-binding protein
LNRYRVNLFIEKIEHQENKLKTLEAIATECGFQSRATFVRAFKKEKGITPSEYIKNTANNP